MFGTSCPTLSDTNVLLLLWTYLVKNDGHKKARCVCNISPYKKGTNPQLHLYHCQNMNLFRLLLPYRITWYKMPIQQMSLPKHHHPRAHFMSPSIDHFKNGGPTCLNIMPRHRYLFRDNKSVFDSANFLFPSFINITWHFSFVVLEAMTSGMLYFGFIVRP